MSPKAEIDATVRLAQQYLNPNYRQEGPESIKAQQEQAEGVFAQAIAALAQRDQDVLKIWKVVKKVKNKK